MPSGSTSFTLKGFEKGSKDTDLGAKCRLCSGVVWVLHTEAWGTNLEPYLPPLNHTQKLLPGDSLEGRYTELGGQHPPGRGSCALRGGSCASVEVA